MNDFLIISAMISWAVLGSWCLCLRWLDEFGKLTIGSLIFNCFFGSFFGPLAWIAYWTNRLKFWDIEIYRRKK